MQARAAAARTAAVRGDNLPLNASRGSAACWRVNGRRGPRRNTVLLWRSYFIGNRLGLRELAFRQRPASPPLAVRRYYCYTRRPSPRPSGGGARAVRAGAGRGKARQFRIKDIVRKGSSTASVLVMATKRSIVHNVTSGIAPPPRAWSIQTGQCSAARTPPRAVPRRGGGEIRRPRAQTGEMPRAPFR